jgi:hypothetical protein
METFSLAASIPWFIILTGTQVLISLNSSSAPRKKEKCSPAY